MTALEERIIVRFCEEYFLQMVDSAEDMLFAYNKREDMLYFSVKAREDLGFQEKVRRYWKESQDWNRIAQEDQERLVNLLRYQGHGGVPVIYDVLLKSAHGRSAVMCRVEAANIWDYDDPAYIIGVRGKMSLL